MAFEGTFRHVGYVVEDLDAALDHFTALFDLEPASIDVIPPREVETPSRFAFFEVGGCVFELIHPTAEPFLSQLAPDGITIDHVAFTTSDLDAEVARLGGRGIQPGHVTPDGAVTMPRQRMCYFGPNTTGGVLLELVEPTDAADPDRRW